MSHQPSPGSVVAEFFAVYGSAVLAVQHLEQVLSTLHVVVSIDVERHADASEKRRLIDDVQRRWAQLQAGDLALLREARGVVRPVLPTSLFTDLDRFMNGPRQRVLHRFLIERASVLTDGSPQELGDAATELLESARNATRLASELDSHVVRIRSQWAGDPTIDEAWVERMVGGPRHG